MSTALTRAVLAGELRDCADELGRMQAAVTARWDADADQPWRQGLDISVFEAVDPAGRPLLADVLSARANVLAALAAIELTL